MPRKEVSWGLKKNPVGDRPPPLAPFCPAAICCLIIQRGFVSFNYRGDALLLSLSLSFLLQSQKLKPRPLEKGADKAQITLFALHLGHAATRL